MNGDSFKRISQEGQRQDEEEGGILEGASAFAQRVLEEIEALAGTTACKEPPQGKQTTIPRCESQPYTVKDI